MMILPPMDGSLRILQVVTDIRGPAGEVVTDIRTPGGEVVTDIKTTGSGEIITEIIEGRNLTVEAFISAPQGQPLDKKYYTTIADRPLDEQLSATLTARSHLPLLNMLAGLPSHCMDPTLCYNSTTYPKHLGLPLLQPLWSPGQTSVVAAESHCRGASLPNACSEAVNFLACTEQISLSSAVLAVERYRTKNPYMAEFETIIRDTGMERQLNNRIEALTTTVRSFSTARRSPLCTLMTMLF